MNDIREETIAKITYAHQEWIAALDAIEYPIFIHDKEFRILRCNLAYQQHAGLPFQEIIGRPYYELFPKNDGPMHHCSAAIEHPTDEGSEEEVQVGESFFFSRGVIIKDNEGNYLYSLHILKDITEEKYQGDRLRESEARYRTLFETMLNGFAYCQMVYEEGLPVDFIYLDVNKAFEQQTGLKNVIGKRVSEVIPGIRESDAELLERYGRVAAGGKPEQFEIYVKSMEMWFFVSVYNPQPEQFIAIFDVITERKESEVSLSRANRALKTLSAGNMALVRAKNESELLQEITNLIVKQAGYNLAAVVYAEENPQKSLTLVAGAGIKGDNHDWANDITWDDTPNGQLPVSYAIRSGETQVCHNIACAIGVKLWKDAALSQGYISNIALPLSNENKAFGALCIYSTEENAFDEEEIRLLEELANDLAYGILNLRTRVLQEQHAILLRQSLEQSIQTIAATVEARDPYTAGHQHRVSELATAIAHEMQLSEDQIQGIHLASIIHDLGKIHIPAEILSKPGRLNKIEFMLIQTHPEEGYNILKDVKFPWPIADIIFQHHEKLDGSGYPKGLKGDEILLEAKIICVADVVEAMSSHRPYRASLGIEPALEEIRRGRGSWYDASVVDACLKLFHDNRFSFNDAMHR